MKMITKKNLIYSHYLEGRSRFRYKRFYLPAFILFFLLLAKINMVSAALSPVGSTIQQEDFNASVTNKKTSGIENPSEVTFSLYNAKTGKPVAGFNPIAEGAVINLAKVGKDLTIVMHVRGIEHIGSVKIGYNKSRNYQLEEQAPCTIKLDYTVESDDSKYGNWAPVLGDNQVTATVYADARAKGEVIIKGSINFKVVEEELMPEDTEDLNNIIAYPNPTVNEINIAVKNSNHASFKVVDPAGTVVKSGNITSLNQEVKVNVYDLKPGLYYIRMLTDEGISTKKIFINK